MNLEQTIEHISKSFVKMLKWVDKEIQIMQYTFITFRSIPSFELQWNECAQKPMLYIGVVERNLVHIIVHHLKNVVL